MEARCFGNPAGRAGRFQVLVFLWAALGSRSAIAIDRVPPGEDPGRVSAPSRSAEIPIGRGAEPAGVPDEPSRSWDAAAVIERVRHRVVESAGRAGHLEATDRLFRAEFAPDGFSMSLRADSSTSAGTGGQTPLCSTPGFDNSPAISISLRSVAGREVARRPWMGELDQATRPVGEGIVEQVLVRGGYLDWTFRLEKPQPEGGDLEFVAELKAGGPPERGDRPAAKGASPARAERGWRFPAGDGRSVRLGEVVVLDAAGGEIHRQLPTIEGTRLSFAIPASVLAGAAFPVTIDPTVSPEYRVGLVTWGPAAGEGENEPAIAWNGTNWLVVWVDSRPPGLNDTDLYAARVSSSGVLLDPRGIAVSTVTYEDPTNIAVAWNGSNFFIVWWTGWAIRFRRVSAAGVLLDGPAEQVATTIVSGYAGQAGPPSLAWNGASHLVTWVENIYSLSTRRIFASRYDAAGADLDPVDIVVASGLPASNAVTSNGSDFFVAWSEGESADPDIYDVRGARISSAGVLLDGPPEGGGIAISTAHESPLRPVVASDGANYLVVWPDSRPGTGYDDPLYAARVSAQGQLLDGPPESGGIPVFLNPDGYPLWSVSVAFGGGNYLAVWSLNFSPGRGAAGVRVSTGGAVLDPSPIRISPAADDDVLSTAVAGGGSSFLVAWADGWQEEPRALRAARVMATGQILDSSAIDLPVRATDRTDPKIAWNGTNLVVAWKETRPSVARSIYLTRVSTAGATLDGTGILVAPDTGFGWAIAAGGSTCLVVWSDGPRILGRRFTAAGVLLDATPIVIYEAIDWRQDPELAFDGSNYLVVWSDFQNHDNGCSYDVYGRRVSAAGVPLDGASGIPIATGTGEEDTAHVAWDGTRFLVVWSAVSLPTIRVEGRRVSSSGALLDAAAIPISPPVPLANSAHVSGFASDGSSFLVSWDTRAPVGYEDDVWAQRVRGVDGACLDGPGLPVSTASGYQNDSHVVFDGVDFLVAWGDSRNATWEVYGTRVTSGGVLRDGTAAAGGFPVASSPAGGFSPDLVRCLDRKVAVAYGRRDTSDPIGGSDQVFVRFLCPDLALAPLVGKTVCEGGSASWSVVPTGSGPFSYAWSKDGIPLANGGNVSGVFWPTLTISPVTPADAGTYAVTVTDGCAAALASNAATLVVSPKPPAPSVTRTSGANPSCAGDPVVLQASGSFESVLWSTGATTASITVAPTTTTSYTVRGYVSGCAGDLATIDQSVVPIPATPIASNTGPVCSGSSMQLTASTVTGATYAWSGPGGFSSTQQNPTIYPVAPTHAGTYSVVARAGGCNSLPATTDVVVLGSPTIAVQPASQVVCANTPAIFSVASPDGATYQWRRNGSIILGATSPEYTIAQAKLIDSGKTFTCTVTNACGSVTSLGALLTVNSSTPPSAVGNSVVADRSGGGVVLRWADIPGASSYRVYEDTSASGTFATVSATATSGATGVVLPVSPAAEAYYRVAGQSPCGEGPK